MLLLRSCKQPEFFIGLSLAMLLDEDYEDFGFSFFLKYKAAGFGILWERPASPQNQYFTFQWSFLPLYRTKVKLSLHFRSL